MSIQLAKRLFTVKEYYRMAEAGILTAEDRVELLEGEIVSMTPIGSRHADCVDRLARLLIERLARQAIVRVQNPVYLSEFSEPQPDLAVVRQRPTYAVSHPGPEDIFLVIEVADTTVETDRGVKVPLYARAGIAEAWLVDLPESRIEVYRQPMPQGYQEASRLERGGSLHVTAFPDLTLQVDDVFGPI